MQVIAGDTLISRFALLSDNPTLISLATSAEVLVVSETQNFNQPLHSEVVALDLNFLKSHPTFEKLSTRFKKKILIVDHIDEQIPVSILNAFFPDKICTLSDFKLQDLLELDDQISQENQDATFLSLASELNQEYENIKIELEKKLTDSQRSLIESRQKILESNNRSESLRKILYSITQESDLNRIETVLNELIPSSTSVTWIKIIPHAHRQSFEQDLEKQLSTFFHVEEIKDHQLYFIKGDKKSFRKSEVDLFLKIGDALRLNISRVENLNHLLRTEKISTTAFHSFRHPLLVVNKDYEIESSNTAFNKFKAADNKCYQALFNRNEPCVGCHFGQNFSLNNSGDKSQINYDVHSHYLNPRSGDAPTWVNFYKDRSEEILLEQRMTQTAKMKELGLISSSIAHELNNPLGGILSYLQIIQMDLPKDHTLQGDITEMLKASLRMKKIIEDLLIFSRRPQLDEKSLNSITSLVAESISMNEMQFKIENIKVVNHAVQVASEQKVLISKSAFRDSVHFILNFFIERSRLLRKSKPQFTGLIEVKFSQDQIKSYLEFQGNFGPLEKDQKLKDIHFLTIHKTLLDQGFQVELTEPNTTWVAIQVVLPNRTS